jgi:hypothetical protein
MATASLHEALAESAQATAENAWCAPVRGWRDAQDPRVLQIEAKLKALGDRARPILLMTILAEGLRGR